MIFSKSFGYAVRGILYIAMMQDTKQYVQAEEIAETLSVPRHFMSKILKRLVKAGVLASSKGKTGGFTVNAATTSTALMKLFHLTDGHDTLKKCSLRLQDCRADNPCPLHGQMEVVKGQLQKMLASTSIGDLLKGDKQEFIRQLATGY
jgi:Rrf2 family protein